MDGQDASIGPGPMLSAMAFDEFPCSPGVGDSHQSFSEALAHSTPQCHELLNTHQTPHWQLIK